MGDFIEKVHIFRGPGIKPVRGSQPNSAIPVTLEFQRHSECRVMALMPDSKRKYRGKTGN
jgi:hypothetical protein